jgi:sarcosine oxidase subunit beta
MTQNVDAIVVGGGIHGCSTALHLCLAGMKPVLIEKDYAGRHASGVNAGGVRQLARHIPEIPLSIRSMGIWEKIADLVDDDCSFESYGQVLVAENEEELAACRARVAELNALGFTHEELVDATELRRLVPAVAETCPGGIVSRRDGAANPAQTTTAFRRKAERLGAIVREGVAAGNIRHRDGLWHVDVGTEVFAAPVLVNAAGAWAGRIAAMLGDDIPLGLKASMMIVTERIAPLLKPVISIVGRPLSFKQSEQGTLVIGGGLQGRADIEAQKSFVDFQELAKGARAATDLFPSVSALRIVRTWAGMEATTKDHLPVICASPNAKGAFHAFGFSGHGFQLVPVVGAMKSPAGVRRRQSSPACSIASTPTPSWIVTPAASALLRNASRVRCGSAAPSRRAIRAPTQCGEIAGTSVSSSARSISSSCSYPASRMRARRLSSLGRWCACSAILSWPWAWKPLLSPTSPAMPCHISMASREIGISAGSRLSVRTPAALAPDA